MYFHIIMLDVSDHQEYEFQLAIDGIYFLDYYVLSLQQI